MHAPAVATDVPSQSGVQSWRRQLVVQSVLLLLCFFLLSWSEMFSQVCRSEVDVGQLPRIEKWTGLSCKCGSCLVAVRHHSALSGPRRRHSKNDRDVLQWRIGGAGHGIPFGGNMRDEDTTRHPRTSHFVKFEITWTTRGPSDTNGHLG